MIKSIEDTVLLKSASFVDGEGACNAYINVIDIMREQVIAQIRVNPPPNPLMNPVYGMFFNRPKKNACGHGKTIDLTESKR